MIIKETDLDNLTKDEYLTLLVVLINYFYFQFKEQYVLKKVGDEE